MPFFLKHTEQPFPALEPENTLELFQENNRPRLRRQTGNLFQLMQEIFGVVDVEKTESKNVIPGVLHVLAEGHVYERTLTGAGRLVDDGMSAICDNGYEVADVLLSGKEVVASGDGVVGKWGFHVVILFFAGANL